MRFSHVLVVLLIITSCGSQEDERMFTSLSSTKTGVTFSNDLTYKPTENIIEYLYYYNGGGVAVGDINNDGLEDIYLSANQKPNALYLNKGNLEFEDISIQAGISQDTTWSTGVVIVDVNGDGLKDIFECNVGGYKSLDGSNKLYLNKGGTIFEEVGREWGLSFSGFSTNAAFLDFDHDGDLDMYLLNHSVHTPRSYGTTELRYDKDPLAGDRFYENRISEGENRFIDITDQVGIYSSALGYGLGITTLDVNQDGWLDIYVGNDFHENDYLYVNQQNGSFKESLEEYIGHTSRFTMGVDAGDLNNDGLTDIMSLDMLPEDPEILMKSGGEDINQVSEIKSRYGFAPQYSRNALQINKGNGSFGDLAMKTGLEATDWSWSVLIQDFDLDGYTDVFITNGIYKRPNDLDYINFLSNVNFEQMTYEEGEKAKKELIETMPTLKISNKFFRGRGDLSFVDFSEESGCGEATYSNGAAFADFDNDGDMDLVTNNVNQQASIYRNNVSPTKFSLKVSLKGEKWNEDAIGAAVVAYSKSNSVRREISSSRGFQSSSTNNLFFGSEWPFDSLVITWPDGSIQTVKHDLSGVSTIKKKSLFKTEKWQINSVKVDSPIHFVHREDDFSDYNNETLIPYKISREGPAAVSADFNGDGLDDLFIGGAHGQESKIFLNYGGEFKAITNDDLFNDLSHEDVHASASDLDQDGDIDLYVVSAGNKYPEGHDLLEDRIYLNDGNGYLTRLKIDLPRTNGSVVQIEDFDKDGSFEIFVGSRNIPGAFGMSGISYLLKFEKNKVQILKEWRLGMVTDAITLDYNLDSYQDVIVVGEWMSPKLIAGGGEIDTMEPLNLVDSNGFWKSVSSSDVNNDGRPDLLIGNVGDNFRISANADKPIKLYVGDFDGNGKSDPVIFHHYGDEFVPFSPKDDLVKQLPLVKKRFLKFSDFSTVRSIEELVGKEPDLELTVDELESVLLLNREEGVETVNLPEEAQWSIVQASCFADVNSDGVEDLILIGNSSSGLSQLGISDASNGALFLGKLSGDFQFESWLNVPRHLEFRELVTLDSSLYYIPNNDSPLRGVRLSE